DIIYEISSKKLGATVVTADKKVKGIITDGDLRRFFEINGSIKDTAETLMTKSPKTINEDDYAEKAIETMERYKITVLPVVDDSGNLVGIIHLHDILSRK
ncbi:MAG: CBS domain-containing protein, partial [Nitrospiraceae bacterium]|nr:CBS domain-containing protein [Nitrospiraceae bacterium]